MKVFFDPAPWKLLLYMLYDPEWEKTFYCSDDESRMPSYFKDGSHGISCFSFRTHSSLSDSPNFFSWLWYRTKDEVRMLLFIHRLKQKNDVSYWGNDNSFLARAFVGDKFFVVEDGLGSYTPQNIAYLQSIGTLGFGCRTKIYGFDPKIKRVLMSGAFAIPAEMKNKAVCINVKELWEKKTKDEKDKILAVFGTTAEELAQYKSDYVLLTQNYDSYNVRSHEDEYSRYMRILRNYPYGKVLIKPHPRSTFDYAAKFPDYRVVRQGIPFELLAMFNDYKVLISINSTSAFTISSKRQIDLYDLEGNLKKQFDLSDGQKLRAEDIKDLIPKIQPEPVTLKVRLKRLRWALLRRFVWHLE